MSRGLLASGKSNVAMLRRASAVGLARMGDRDAARRELELCIAAARARGEDYEIALALDVQAVLVPRDPDQRAERDAIVARLGVVRLPTIPDLSPGERVQEPASTLASV